jgi:hypothetical protein
MSGKIPLISSPRSCPGETNGVLNTKKKNMEFLQFSNTTFSEWYFSYKFGFIAYVSDITKQVSKHITEVSTHESSIGYQFSRI